MKVLLFDNYDSFTYNLEDYLIQAGAQPTVLLNDTPLSHLAAIPFDAVLLSPGPETPSKAGNLMQVLDHYAKKRPILGVCLGHQAIGEYFGAHLVKGHKPLHGKVSNAKCVSDPLFEGCPPTFEVVHYHSLVLDQVKPPLRILAHTLDDHRAVMAIRHVALPIWGVQWHPEAHLTQYGLRLISNWLAAAKKTSQNQAD